MHYSRIIKTLTLILMSLFILVACEFPDDTPTEKYELQVVATGGKVYLDNLDITGTSQKLTSGYLTLLAVADEGYTFTGWQTNSKICSVSESYRFRLTDDIEIIALFSQNLPDDTEYDLQIATTIGGKVFLDNSDVSNSTQTLRNGYLTLSAEVNEGYAFSNWQVNNQIVSTSLVYVLNFNQNISILATFVESSQQELGVVNILSINDTHGSVLSDASTIGMDKVATVVKTLENDNDYIKIANGDIFQGSYFSNVLEGEPLIACLNELDFDCLVIGNHEFDWGIETFARYKDNDLSNGEAEFPFLSANIIDKRTNQSLSWTEPYAIFENGGLKVGIIGVIGEYLTSSIIATQVANYTFLDPVPIVAEIAQELRTEQDCDIVIVAIHEYETSENQLYANLTGDSQVDAVICAHTHQKIAETMYGTDGDEVPVVQCNGNNQNIATLDLNIADGEVDDFTITHYYPSDYAVDNDMLTLINTYYDDIEAEGKRVVGTNAEYLASRDMAALATTIMADYFDVDFAMINYAGVRASLNAGDVTVQEIYAIFPFDNYLITATLTGARLKSFYNGNNTYVAFNKVIGSNIVDTQEYTIAIIDYVYFQSYNQTYFNQNEGGYVNTNIMIRDVIEDYYQNK